MSVALPKGQVYEHIEKKKVSSLLLKSKGKTGNLP